MVAARNLVDTETAAAVVDAPDSTVPLVDIVDCFGIVVLVGFQD